MLTDFQIDRLYANTAALQRRTIQHPGCVSSAVRAFTECMRWFDDPACEAVTLPVFLNAPVFRPGTITIHRDGHMETRIASDPA